MVLVVPKPSQSKIAIIRPSQRDDADIDYIFAQSGVKDDLVDLHRRTVETFPPGWGHLRLTKALVSNFRKGKSLDPKIRTQEVRILNTGTEKVLISHVPIDQDGYSIASGEYTMAAVPGAGAPILMDYRETVGASRNTGLLPSGNPQDRIDLNGKASEHHDWRCGQHHCLRFCRSNGLSLVRRPQKPWTEDRGLLDRVREVRGKASKLVGTM